MVPAYSRKRYTGTHRGRGALRAAATRYRVDIETRVVKAIYARSIMYRTGTAHSYERDADVQE